MFGKTGLYRGLGALSLALALAPATIARAQSVPEEEPMPPSIQTQTTAAIAPAETVTAPAPPPAVPAGPASEAVPESFLPSLIGPIGLYRISTAEVGPVMHLRLALHGEYFKTDDFLIARDSDSRLNGALTFGFTPHPNVEIFGAFLTSSNRNDRPAEMPARRDPELIKSFGDLVLGPKVIYPLGRGAVIGGELGFRFLSSISDLSFSPSSTSLWIGPLFSLDLRKVAEVPLRVHANANFYVDNSKNLANLDDPNLTITSREVAMFAYGIAANRFRFAFGADMPLENMTAPVPLQPFVEYHIEVVTSGADPMFKGYMPDNRDQQWVTFGLRGRVYRGITLDAGTDVRIRSVGYAYGPPLPPYNVVFGAAYPFDIDSFRRPVVVTRTIEKEVKVAAEPTEGEIAGVVKSSKDGTPVPGALVVVAGRSHARVATDPDGSFKTASLPPGPAELEVTAANFETTKVKAAVTAGRPISVEVALTPKTPTGNVRGKVTDNAGRGLEASLHFAGAESFEARSDLGGLFSAALPVGPYKVTAETPGMPPKEVPLDVATGQDRQLDFVLRPPNPDVTLSGDSLSLKQPIKFRPGAPKLGPKEQHALDGVADTMEDHPELRTLRIETHWDASAGKRAKSITDAQAAAIRDYLVKKGVVETRIEAVGMGAEHPLVPNIGPANKSKNRRVEFHTVK
jgi:outer membrane protein OmpA-like peptidoglycan-associated protein